MEQCEYADGGNGSSLSSSNQLRCQSIETEGECILVNVTPISLSKFRYYLYIVLSICFLGIPAVLMHWFPKLRKILIFSQSSIQECSHFYIVNYDTQVSYAEKQESEGQENYIYFYNRYIKYRINGDVVKADIFPYHQSLQDFVREARRNRKQEAILNEEEVLRKRDRFGIGTMVVEHPDIPTLFFREIMRPLYFFIVFTIIVWFLENYYLFCGVILLSITIGLVLSLYQTYQNNKNIVEMAYYETQVNVLRKKNQQTSAICRISSKEIVPGDIVFMKEPIKIPFDALIIEGSMLINECALTGESAPVVKKSESSKDYADGTFVEKNCMIFEGTTIVQVAIKKKMQIFQEFRKEYGVPVFVIRTNFVTLKGQLVRIILFPVERISNLEKQAQKFLIGIFLMTCIVYWLMVMKSLDFLRPWTIIIHWMDLITVTVPANLPASMTLGILFALDKMKKKEIYSISPNKINFGGLVDFLCFDKTGTLTEDHMDFYALVPCHKGVFQEPIQNSTRDDSKEEKKVSIQQIIRKNPDINHSLTNMASNHTIVKIEETGQNVGDPMQVKLFQFGEFQLNESGKQEEKDDNLSKIIFNFQSKRGHSGKVVKRFNFDSELFRMSAIAEANYPQQSIEGDHYLENDQGKYFIYTKGSPEHMIDVFLKQRFPQNYRSIMNEYASQGLRVLAIGHREVSQKQLNLTRNEIERDLIFDGFEVFENRLKPQTKKAFKDLEHAQIPCVMITGDNALTGCSIAYQCNLFPEQQQVFVIDLAGESYTITQFEHKDKKKRRSSDVGENEVREFRNFEEIVEKIQSEKVQLCITGAAFNKMFSGEEEEYDGNSRLVLEETKVFARTKPHDKAKIIKVYQKLGKIVGMCGDGANDCSALKQADIGLSLSQAEASISAPFTSKITNISSMVQLIKECRAGMITNFNIFNAMALYSLVQFTSEIICQYFLSFPHNDHFFYWDVCGNFLLFLFIGYTGTADTLSPIKPPSSLFSLTNSSQMFIMFLLQLLGQLFMIFSIVHIFPEESGYYDHGGIENNKREYFNKQKSEYNLISSETNVLFLFSNFMYIATFLSFFYSKPYRKPFYTNWLLMLCLTFSFSSSVLIALLPEARLGLFSLIYMTNASLCLFIVMVGLIIGTVMYINQKCLMEPLANHLRQKYPDKKWI